MTFIYDAIIAINMGDRILILGRGPSGSGKTTMMNNLASLCCSKTPIILSADDYFMVDGEYQFDVNKLKDAHAQCQRLADEYMGLGERIVMIDNTNTMRWEMEPYLELAEKHDYSVVIAQTNWKSEDVELYAERNIHGVPLATIYNQMERWEA